MDVNSSNYGFNFTVGRCGKIILDVPMVENVSGCDVLSLLGKLLDLVQHVLAD